MSTINLRYPVYAPIDCIRMDWPIGPTTKNLKEALALYREDLGLDEEEEDEEWD